MCGRCISTHDRDVAKAAFVGIQAKDAVLRVYRFEDDIGGRTCSAKNLNACLLPAKKRSTVTASVCSVHRSICHGRKVVHAF